MDSKKVAFFSVFFFTYNFAFYNSVSSDHLMEAFISYADYNKFSSNPNIKLRLIWTRLQYLLTISFICTNSSWEKLLKSDVFGIIQLLP